MPRPSSLLLLLPPLLLLLLLSPTATDAAVRVGALGVNYGRLGSNLPPPARAVQLIKSVGAARVKLYDADPSVLSALAGTGLQVSVMLPNQLIPAVAANQSDADRWVAVHLLPFGRSVRIRFLLVGNEVLSDPSLRLRTWPALVPAMSHLRRALRTHRPLRHVKVGTPLAMDALSSSFPPSAGAFRPDVAEAVVRPMLRFLRRARSFFFVDAYPYFVWAANPGKISLNYALLEGGGVQTYADPGSGLNYTNLLDQQLDAVAAAMSRLGFRDIPLAIAETGWPNAGDYDEAGANARNAAAYNRNLAQRMAARRPAGTPARPRAAIPTFVFSLFDEDRKPGPGTERHWGLFHPNGTAVYGVDLAGRAPDGAFGPLPAPTMDEPYRGRIWCVAANGSDGGVNATTELVAAVAYACGQLGKGACDAIRPGGICYRPNSPVTAEASYVFNAYWQQYRRSGGTCFFNGVAAQTIRDPSFGSCEFPSVAN